MKTNYIFLLFFFFILLGCSDDKNVQESSTSTNDIYEGIHDQISFTKETKDFTYGDLIFYIKTPDGNIIQRNAKHKRISNTSLFSMERGLKEGKYQLLYLEYTIHSDCPDIDGRKGNYGMGCYITVNESGITPENNFDERIGLNGSGTPENPYRITSADDLEKIKEALHKYHDNGNLVNSGTCFEQQNDINMENHNPQCAWEGNWYQIGLSSIYPFTGYYNGNGYAIKGLKMLDKNAVGASLFGYVNQAVISNLTIDDAEITGYGALSAIAGAIITKGGNIDKTYIKGCVVKRSSIKSRDDGMVSDGMAIGGIAGMVDPNVNLWIDSCSVEDCNINGAIAVGGILGGGTTYSLTQITNSHNRGSNITADYNCAGGIVGYADTLYVYSCSNDGTIKGATSTKAPAGNLPDNSIYNVGTGGIVGGSGLSTIISSRNSGTVQGGRGVGGIIGSTLVSTNPQTYYNNTFIGFCSNSGNVNGDSYIGGICGESQLGVYKCYNEGTIKANASFAGGIVGFSPLSSITNAVNFAKVTADSYSGGIAGSTITGSLAINTNLGEITSVQKYTGGIIGKAGSVLAMNYCSNFAKISGSSYTGGIIGEIGDYREWTIMDGVSIVFASFELATTFVGFVPIGEVWKTGGLAINSILLLTSIVLNNIDIISYRFSIYDLITSGHQGIMNIEKLKGIVVNDIETFESDMDEKLAQKTNSLTPVTMNGLRTKDMINKFISNRKTLTTWFENETNNKTFSEAMNYKRELISKKVYVRKKAEAIAHTVVSGVCLAANTAILFTSFVTFPEGIPVVAALSGVVAVVGFVNSVTATLDDFADNSVVITQCFNAGEIHPKDSKKYNGGLIGEFQQNCFISDCVNAGNSNRIGNSLIGHSNRNTHVRRNLNVGVGWNQFTGTDALGIHYQNNYCLDGTIQVIDTISHLNYVELNLLMKPSTFNEWDFDVKWEIPSNESGSFPIPNKSEMQFEKPQL